MSSSYPILSDGAVRQDELDDLQADFQSTSMQVACSVYKYVTADTNSGGKTRTRTLVVNTVCSIAWSTHRPPQERVDEKISSVQSRSYWTLLLPVGTEVGPDYEIDARNQTFRVVTDLEPKTLEVCIPLTCVLLNARST